MGTIRSLVRLLRVQERGASQVSALVPTEESPVPRRSGASPDIPRPPEDLVLCDRMRRGHLAATCGLSLFFLRLGAIHRSGASGMTPYR
jgi:hypothetical protein